jgi:hypothetical protein
LKRGLKRLKAGQFQRNDYSTRHGPGPFVPEDATLPIVEDFNVGNRWQGDFRVGPFDLVATKYAMEITKVEVGRLKSCQREDATIVLRAKDRQLGFTFSESSRQAIAEQSPENRNKTMKDVGKSIYFDLFGTDELSKERERLFLRNIELVFHPFSEKQIKMFEERYGLKDGKPRTFEEVGRLNNVTRARAEQVVNRVLAKLRDRL